MGSLFVAVDSYFDCLERATAAAEVVARFIQTLIETSEVRISHPCPPVERLEAGARRPPLCDKILHALIGAYHDCLQLCADVTLMRMFLIAQKRSRGESTEVTPQSV